jgi:diguanylate cyclase (GGDEF)-like protein
MIDIGETLAQPKDRSRAVVGATGVIALCAATIPFVGRPLGASYPVLSIVMGISIVMLLLTAVLLWAQSRVTASVPLLVLAAIYGATAIVMMPYLLFYHGLWPELAEWVAADPQASGWLWFAWHALFALGPIAYLAARRRIGKREKSAFTPLQVRLLAGMVGVAAIIIVPAVWVQGLPAFFSANGARTPLALICSGIVVLIAVGAIAALYQQNRFRSILDVWLGIASLCMIADVTLAVSGVVPFSVGWYVSRVYIVIASAMVLTALLLQTANVYAQLAKTADQLRDESLTDALTGLANRRSFDLRLAQVLADGTRMSRGAAMLMIDVDQFKLFNDTYGHLGGDECLRDLCTTAKGCVSRTRDMVARYGGEEIAVIMAETDLRGAMIVAERIRSAIAGMGIPQSREATHPAVTVSIGAVAVDDTKGLTPEAFIGLADRALYRAKETGRNKTVSWPIDESDDQAEATGNERGTDAGSRATIS